MEIFWKFSHLVDLQVAQRGIIPVPIRENIPESLVWLE